MKYALLSTLLFLAAILSVDAQQLQKKHVIVKTDVSTILLHHIGLEAELQINQRNSFIFRTSWQKMNRDLPILHAGTYEQDYQVIQIDRSATLLNGRDSRTIVNPKPLLEKSIFLATSVMPFQASFRTYLGKKDQKVRFYIQPGVKILRFQGLQAQVDQTLISRETVTDEGGWGLWGLFIPGTTTTTETYHQTTTVTHTSGKTVGGCSLDFGLHLASKGRWSCDAGMQLGLNDAAGVYGLQKTYFTPMMSVGVRI